MLCVGKVVRAGPLRNHASVRYLGRNARPWTNAGDAWSRHYDRGHRALVRLRRELAGTASGRHPDRARQHRLLFPDRHLHYHQHCPDFADVAFSSLTQMSRASGKQQLLNRHVARLLQCRRCPRMLPPPVSGGPVLSKIMLIGQAPGVKEPVLAKPFAWTAGRTLFGWFQEFCGMDEQQVRATIYFAAVCRCFPGKTAAGGDRVPTPDEIRNCSNWMNDEIDLLQPYLIIPVGN